MSPVSRAFALAILSCYTFAASAQEPLPGDSSLPDSTDLAKAEILAAVAAYEKAFNEKDLESIARFWTDEGYFDRSSESRLLIGREQIVAEFASFFDEDEAANLSLKTQAIELISPTVAIEQGVATTTVDEQPLQSDYRTVFVKRDGKWKIDRVSEEAPEPVALAYTQLAALEFLVGDWVGATDEGSIEYQCRWTQNRSFLQLQYRVVESQGASSSGLQLIGWDENRREIRGWTFEQDGTVIEATWRKRDASWISQSVATLPNGTTGTHTIILRPIPGSGFGWQKLNCVVDGRILPNIDELIIRPEEEVGALSPDTTSDPTTADSSQHRAEQ